MKGVFSLLCFFLAFTTIMAEPDIPFEQAVSVKYSLSDELKGADLRKIVVDFDDRLHLLTKQGMYRIIDHRVVKDISYRPLANRAPLDISIQEESGYLYYLYDGQFLTNENAGYHYGNFAVATYDRLAVNHAGKVLLSGPSALAMHADGKLSKLLVPKGKMLDVQMHRGQFYLLTDEAVIRLEGEKLQKIHATNNVSSMTFRGMRSYWVLPMVTMALTTGAGKRRFRG
ncbi:MAG: hypothetical protein ACLFT3_09960 [Cyclobacteriaceae bacterium]